MSDRVTAATKRHADSSTVRHQLTRTGQGEISDDVALTVASWYQSPGTVGNVLAQLASTGSADLDELLDDIHHTRKGTTDAADHRALDCLATWAINHPSR